MSRDYPRRTSHIGPVAVTAAAVRALHATAQSDRALRNESIRNATRGLAEHAAARAAAAEARRANLATPPPGGPPPDIRPRPTLTASNAVEYVDWALSRARSLKEHGTLDAHIRGAELVIRIHMAEAQAKDTQHTLVRDGVIDPPPQAS